MLGFINLKTWRFENVLRLFSPRKNKLSHFCFRSIFRSGELIFFVTECNIRDQEYNANNIVLFSTNQITYILYVSDKIF